MEPISLQPRELGVVSRQPVASKFGQGEDSVPYLLKAIERLATIVSYCHPVRLLQDNLGSKDRDIMLLAQGPDANNLWSYADPHAAWPFDELLSYTSDVLQWAASTVVCNRQYFARRRQLVAKTLKRGMGATALALRLHDLLSRADPRAKISVCKLFGCLACDVFPDASSMQALVLVC